MALFAPSTVGENAPPMTHGWGASSRTCQRSGFAAALGPAYDHPPLQSVQVEIDPPPLYPSPVKSSASCSHDSLTWHLALLRRPPARVFPRGRSTLDKDRPVQRRSLGSIDTLRFR